MNARRSILAILCALAGVLAFTGAPAVTGASTGGAAPTVSNEAVSKVSATSAVLSAQINAQQEDTTYHFEYDTTPYTTSAMHGTNLPVPDADIGEGSSNVPVSQESQTLKPNTTYHYRVVATNSTETTDGSEHTFETQTQGGEFVLPDRRAWEMVSPPNKNGALLGAIGGAGEGGVMQAAAGGGAFTWIANTAIGAEPAGNLSLQWSQIFSVRGADGWSSRDLEPPHTAATGWEDEHGTEYDFFSSDLSLGLVEPKGEAPLSPETTEKTIYLRNDAGDSYLPLVTAANVPEGTKFGGHLEGQVLAGAPTFEGASPDLSHVVFTDEAGLDKNYPDAKRGLYEWVGGQVQLVSVLPGPDGEPATEPNLGYRDGRVMHAISNDGSRVFWDGSGHLYLRDIERSETLQLSPGQATFQAASSDGSRVFFTEGGSLYECAIVEAAAGDECQLTNLTHTNGGENPGVQGTLPGASEDGSYVYLVATGILSEAESAEHEEPVSGADNLYVLHDTETGWTTRFVARLSSEDGNGDWNAGGENSGVSDLSFMTSRVSPNGRYLAFMSDRELTGYDNHDANSGVADEEVYLYHAPENVGTEPGTSICASCDPTGARPVGVFYERTAVNGRPPAAPLFDEAGVWQGRWVAANIPGWTSRIAEFYASYQSRYLSDSGRLFFNSSDGLVPEDTNGNEDVYEYEPVGVGICTEGTSSGSSVYEPARTYEVEDRKGESVAGCIGLISSGNSAKESVFLDASESGGDVFFLTAAKLVSQDYDADLDVYDAHECTTQSPCESAPVSPSECTTADACRVPSAPQPSIFGAPPSQTFSGAGNLAPVSNVAKTKTKVHVLTRAQKLAEALKACRQKRQQAAPSMRQAGSQTIRRLE